MSTLVSIILPTFNRDDLLPRSLGSVITQTYPDWELIVWDDGSTDTTASLVRSYNDPRIRYVYSDNRGPAWARNQAARLVRGEYLAFLDSDDEWLPQKLAAQVSALDAHTDVDLLFSDFINIRAGSPKTARGFEQNQRAMRHMVVEQAGEDLFFVKGGLLEGLAIQNFIATPTVMLRREAWEECGGFNAELKHSEDFELWWRMGLSGKRFAFSRNASLKRIKPAGSLSSPNRAGVQHRLQALDICAEQAARKGRPELVARLRLAYRNAWQHLIRLHGQAGDAKKMVQAFRMTQQYGLRPGSLRLLVVGSLHLLTQKMGASTTTADPRTGDGLW